MSGKESSGIGQASGSDVGLTYVVEIVCLVGIKVLGCWDVGHCVRVLIDVR